MQPVLYSGYLYKSGSMNKGTLSRRTREGRRQCSKQSSWQVFRSRMCFFKRLQKERPFRVYCTDKHDLNKCIPPTEQWSYLSVIIHYMKTCACNIILLDFIGMLYQQIYLPLTSNLCCCYFLHLDFQKYWCSVEKSLLFYESDRCQEPNMKIEVKDIICLGVSRPDSCTNNNGFIDRYSAKWRWTFHKDFTSLDMHTNNIQLIFMHTKVFWTFYCSGLHCYVSVF